MTTARLWFVRVVLALVTPLYTFIGYLFMTDPAGAMAGFSVELQGAIGHTTARIGYGMGFWSLALTALYGLLRPKHMFACLSLLTFMLLGVVLTRLTGFVMDGIDDKQWSELRDEGSSFVIFVAAWLAYPRALLASAPGAHEGAITSPTRTNITRARFSLLALGYGVFGILLWFDPRMVESRGMMLNAAVSLTTIRTGLGAHYICLALIALYGLLKPAQRLACFWFVTMWTVLILAGRLVGMSLDGIDQGQINDLIADAILAVVAVAGLIVARPAIKPGS